MRVPVHQDTHVTISGRDAELRVVDAEGVDLSEGGCQLRSAVPFTVGDAVQLQCCLNGANVQLAGHVVRAWPDTDSYTAGIRTTGHSTAAQDAVARFVIESSLAVHRTDALNTHRQITA